MTETNHQLSVIDKAKPIIQKAEKAFKNANPHNMSFAQESGFAMLTMQENPYLLNCKPETILSAIASVALTGITLNPAMKYAYLIPRKSKDGLKCCLDISYIGMIKILTDAGAVKNITAEVVYEFDEFTYGFGSNPILEHKPNLLKERGKPIGAYAIAYFRDGGFQFEVMAKPEIEKVRATSESWKNEKMRQYSPWEAWFDQMWCKTVLKRLIKLLPKTHFDSKLIAALSKEHENELVDTADTKGRIDSIFEDVAEVIPAERKQNPVTSKSIKDEKVQVPDSVFNEAQEEIKKDQEK